MKTNGMRHAAGDKTTRETTRSHQHHADTPFVLRVGVIRQTLHPGRQSGKNGPHTDQHRPEDETALPEITTQRGRQNRFL